MLLVFWILSYNKTTTAGIPVRLMGSNSVEQLRSKISKRHKLGARLQNDVIYMSKVGTVNIISKAVIMISKFHIKKHVIMY